VEVPECAPECHPSEAADTSPSCKQSLEHNTHTSVADSEVGAEENGRESQSDEFSAAAAHWLMDTLDNSDDNTQPTQATTTFLGLFRFDGPQQTASDLMDSEL
jgi:hypothetical protein